jgi:hypothetical protein
MIGSAVALTRHTIDLRDLADEKILALLAHLVFLLLVAHAEVLLQTLIEIAVQYLLVSLHAQVVSLRRLGRLWHSGVTHVRVDVAVRIVLEYLLLTGGDGFQVGRYRLRSLLGSEVTCAFT